ncbi:MFS transporter [Martelella mediterranea]|uniref:Sugar phosphate permease n=1 Tax=Martelella mediterranea TaxID=293089 RepID=A0A4R3NS99_9HYPH|nr:MFS transporter [Martelella mediterranea]TCT39037.1 sugar phosphate permease [Martelella mediterranea]
MLASASGARFAAFRHVAYTRYFFSRLLATFAIQIVSVSVGWQIYDETGSALYLGLIGLFQFLPSLLLTLVTGTVADRYNRRMIAAICFLISTGCAAGLLMITMFEVFSPWPIFALLIVFGTERAFAGPALQSLAPNLVPQDDLANAIAWNSSSWQIASIVGPVTGGLLYGAGPSVAYTTALVLFAAAAVLILMIGKPPQRSAGRAVTKETILAGFRFIASEKVVLGAISLDLFVVLLGGAVALMPIFARDILDLGPWGLGLLRAAPGIGAIVVAVLLATLPIRRHAGVMMFLGVALFGVATIVFGLSQTVWLSIVALVIMGGADMVSVYVRETLIALWTPDEVRGRVNAVNMVFVGASNELGEFRAGSMASVIGAVPAVVFGGIGSLFVAALWAVKFTKLRQIDSLEAPEHLQGR